MKSFFKFLLKSPHRRYLIFFIILFLLFNLPSIILNSLTPLIEKKIINEINNTGLEIKYSNLKLTSFRNINISNLIISKNGITQLHINDINLSIKKLIPPFAISSNLLIYDGTLNCVLLSSGMTFKHPFNLDCNLNNLNLKNHHFLFALGVEGYLSGAINGLINSNINDSNLNMNLQLNSAKFNSNKNLLTKMLKLPDIDNIDTELKSTYSNNNIEILEGTLLSSHVKITEIKGLIGQANLNPNISLNGIIQLSTKGEDELDKWLSVLNNNTPLSQTPHKLTINGSLKNPNVRFNK